eukprot:5768465-Alexandrium_andersonii.AAC.1
MTSSEARACDALSASSSGQRAGFSKGLSLMRESEDRRERASHHSIPNICHQRAQHEQHPVKETRGRNTAA